MFASNSAEATRILTLLADLLENQTVPRRWKIRHNATNPCRIFTQVHVDERHSHHAHLQSYLQSHLLITRLRTQVIARIMKLVQIIRITALNATPCVTAGR